MHLSDGSHLPPLDELDRVDLAVDMATQSEQRALTACDTPVEGCDPVGTSPGHPGPSPVDVPLPADPIDPQLTVGLDESSDLF